MGQFDNKTVLVTGATGGIGKAIALQFAREGAQVIVAGRRREEGQKVVSEIDAIGATGSFLSMDVSDAASIDQGMNNLKDRFSKIDIIIANAGIEQPQTAPLTELSSELIHQVVDTNLKGVLFTAKYGIPLLKKPGSAFIITSSLWGMLGGAGLTVYSATKGGLNALTRALAIEWGPSGVRVNAVGPGAIETPMLWRYTNGADMSPFYKANVPLGRSGLPEEIAEGIVWLASDAASYVTAQILGIDGGITSKMSTAAS